PGRVGELAPLLATQGDRSKLGAWIVMDRLMEASVTLVIGLIGLTIVLGVEGRALIVAWAFGILSAIVAAAFLFSRHERLERWIQRTQPGTTPRRWLESALAASVEFRLLGRRTPLLMGITLGATCLDLYVGFLLYASFGVWVAFMVLAAAQCVHAIASVIPLTPNATGIPYAAAAVLLHQAAGVAPEVLAAAIGVRFLMGNLVFWSFFGIVLSRTGQRRYTSQGELFDRLAEDDTLYDYGPEALSRLRDLVPDGGPLLDIGCGDGTMAQAMRGKSVFGLDLSARCAGLASRRGVPCAVADATQGLPFASGSFDRVMCIDVLHHVHHDWPAIFAEMDRVLRAGGSLVLVEPDARNPFVRWTQAPGSPIRVAPWHDEPAIYPEELAAHLTELGYEFTCRPIHIDGAQRERSVFPLWQRIAKAPFVLAAAYWYRNRPNKFAYVATKPGRGGRDATG
ncbi:MAG: methyltransferase domain-containing protein, partial [Candidatus Hydrogenedentes bacterium]|nr:methyltransferase domain-containing protein [Candidatus Hydrogenedentota bacterium]